MAVEPTYVHVPDGRRFLRVTASRQSQRLQVVRVWGAEIASKTSKMWWMDNTELRPDHQQSTEAYIPSQTMPDYWLAIQVFSNAGKGWFQSIIGATPTLRVPALDLAFYDYIGGEAIRGSGRPSVALSIVYGERGQTAGSPTSPNVGP